MQKNTAWRLHMFVPLQKQQDCPWADEPAFRLKLPRIGIVNSKLSRSDRIRDSVSFEPCSPAGKFRNYSIDFSLAIGNFLPGQAVTCAPGVVLWP